jgi:hypothetical protein
VAAARDAFVVLGLGDSIMYGIAPHEGGDVPGERMRVALRIGLPATSWTSGRCSRTDGSSFVRSRRLDQRLLLVHSRLHQMRRTPPSTTNASRSATTGREVAEPLVALHERVRGRGRRLVVLASPDLGGDTARANGELSMLREVAAGHGFEVIDLAGWLDGVPAASIRMDAPGS